MVKSTTVSNYHPSKRREWPSLIYPQDGMSYFFNSSIYYAVYEHSLQKPIDCYDLIRHRASTTNFGHYPVKLRIMRSYKAYVRGRGHRSFTWEVRAGSF